jgi:hypothetical protein
MAMTPSVFGVLLRSLMLPQITLAVTQSTAESPILMASGGTDIILRRHAVVVTLKPACRDIPMVNYAPS